MQRFGKRADSFDVSLNAQVAKDHQPGEDGLPREIVALNAGAALYAAGVASDIADGIARARAAIASGAARAALERFVATTRRLAGG